jgi:hypothetical protein
MNTYDKEELALDAVIALTLRACDVSEEQIQKDAEDYLTKNVKLSPEYKKAINGIKNRILNESNTSSISIPPSKVEIEYEESYMAMHRDNSNEKLDVETEEELKKRRQKIIDEQKKKKDDGNKD